MAPTQFIDRLRSVHPQLRILYRVRIIWHLLLIPVVFSIFYDIGKDRNFYIVFLLTCLALSHFTFCLSAISNNPRRTEILINHPIEYSFFVFWLPILHFNPYLVMLLLISLSIVAFTDKQTVILITTLRIIGAVLATGISTAILNFPRKSGHRVKPQSVSSRIHAAFYSRVTSDVFFGCRKFRCN